MFCTNCGLELPDDARFCSRCGALVEGDGTATNGLASLSDGSAGPAVATMEEHVSAATDKSRKRIPLVLLVVLVALAVATAAFAAWAVWTYVIAPVPIEQPAAEVVVDEGEVEQGADEESTPEPVPSVAYEVVNGAPDGSTLREDWPFSYATFTGADGGEAAAERMNAVIMDDVSAAWEEYQQYAAMAESSGALAEGDDGYDEYLDRGPSFSFETWVTGTRDGFISLVEKSREDSGGLASTSYGVYVMTRTFALATGEEVEPQTVIGLSDAELHDATASALLAYSARDAAERGYEAVDAGAVEALLARNPEGYGTVDGYCLTPDGIVLNLDVRMGGDSSALSRLASSGRAVFVAPWPGAGSSYQPGDDYSDAMASMQATGTVTASSS